MCGKIQPTPNSFTLFLPGGKLTSVFGCGLNLPSFSTMSQLYHITGITFNSIDKICVLATEKPEKLYISPFNSCRLRPELLFFGQSTSLSLSNTASSYFRYPDFNTDVPDKNMITLFLSYLYRTSISGERNIAKAEIVHPIPTRKVRRISMENA